MAQMNLRNRTNRTIAAGTFVILKVSEGANHHLILPKNPDVIGFTLADVPAGAWGDAEDVGSEPVDDD